MVKLTAEDWRKLLMQYRADEEPVGAFCGRHKITVSSYYYWRARISKEPLSSINFLPVVAKVDKVIDAVELFMPKGLTLRFSPGASAGYVADIIKALV